VAFLRGQRAIRQPGKAPENGNFILDWLSQKDWESAAQ
jgi:hypothetical protein